MPPPPGRLSISGMPAMVPVDRSIHSCTLGALVVWAWAPRLAMHRPAARQAGVKRERVMVGSRRYRDHPANHRGPQSGFVAAL